MNSQYIGMVGQDVGPNPQISPNGQSTRSDLTEHAIPIDQVPRAERNTIPLSSIGHR
jgi:hypothetical protein